MLNTLSRFLQNTSWRTVTVCASVVLISACASDNSSSSSGISSTRPDSSYITPPTQSSGGDIWGRVRKGYAMPDLVNDEVTRKESYYSQRADYVNRMASRSGDFMFLIMNEVERRHMPSEIALLPFVESAFVTTANSPVKASGLWQFMPATGRDFSLQQNHFADQRNDVVASTDAALTFLQRLHDQFGDWHLALAAYNWGPGNVTKAVRRAQAAGLSGMYTDIRMPLETQQYVPKLQAIKNIISDPARFGIVLPNVENNIKHEVVSITRDIDVSRAAELSGLGFDGFTRLNPAFTKTVIPASLGTKVLVLASHADKMRDALNGSKNLASVSTYSAYNTESLTDIAAQFGTDDNTLRSLNGIPQDHTLIKAGSSLLVPRTSKGQDIPYQALTAGLTTSNGGFGLGGDYAIAKPIYGQTNDESVRQDRSGIVASNLFAPNPGLLASAGPGLTFGNSANNDGAFVAQKTNINTLNDPVAAKGALIVNTNNNNFANPISTITPQLNPNLFDAKPTFVATAPIFSSVVEAPLPTTNLPLSNSPLMPQTPVDVVSLPVSNPILAPAMAVVPVAPAAPVELPVPVAVIPSVPQVTPAPIPTTELAVVATPAPTAAPSIDVLTPFNPEALTQTVDRQLSAPLVQTVVAPVVAPPVATIKPVAAVATAVVVKNVLTKPVFIIKPKPKTVVVSKPVERSTVVKALPKGKNIEVKVASAHHKTVEKTIVSKAPVKPSKSTVTKIVSVKHNKESNIAKTVNITKPTKTAKTNQTPQNLKLVKNTKTTNKTVANKVTSKVKGKATADVAEKKGVKTIVKVSHANNTTKTQPKTAAPSKKTAKEMTKKDTKKEIKHDTKKAILNKKKAKPADDDE